MVTRHSRLPMYQPASTVRYAFPSFEEAIEAFRKSQMGVVSLLTATDKCPHGCPFCISQETTDFGVPGKSGEINRERFHRCMEYAVAAHCQTIMMTGKGEPLLDYRQVTAYLLYIAEEEQVLRYVVPAKELQTSGVLIAQQPKLYATVLPEWAALGLTTIAISISHYDARVNRRIYLPKKDKYINLSKLIKQIHVGGIRVRLATVMFDGGIDSAKKLQRLIAFARRNNVEELTVRPVNKPENQFGKQRTDNVSLWVGQHHLKPWQHKEMEDFLRENGKIVKTLPHGAVVFDVDGQNVCLTNSLTPNTQTYYRQIIFYNNAEGDIMTDWVNAERLP